jgi:small subunit ribosomal protein S8
MYTDPIADMLTRIRNAVMARQSRVTMPHSNMKAAIAGILVQNDFVAGSKVTGTAPMQLLEIDLKPIVTDAAISSLTRVSKPGRRVYVKADEIPTVLSGRGLVILSTPGGIMSGQEARKKRLGGELICKVW